MRKSCIKANPQRQKKDKRSHTRGKRYGRARRSAAYSTPTNSGKHEAHMGNQDQLPVQHANAGVLVKCLNPENLNCHLKMGLFPCCGYVQSVLKYFWDSEPVLHLHSSNISDLLLEGGLVPGYSILKPKQKKTKKKQL